MEREATTFRQIRDFVERAVTLHRGMAAALATRAPEMRDEKQKVLLQTLASGERELAAALEGAMARYGRDDGEGRREHEAWVQNGPTSLLHDAERRTRQLVRLRPEELEHEARAASRTVTLFFDRLGTGLPESSRSELLQSLRDLEERFDRRHSATVSSSLA